MKKNRWMLFVTALLFAGICLADLLCPDRSFSAQENRKLAQKPALSAEAVLEKRYMTAYETYVTDQFPGRDSWISAKTGAERAAGKKDANGVYFAPGNTLLERHTPESVETERAQKKAARLLREAGEIQQLIPGKAAVMLVPSSAAVQPQRLPAHAVEFDQAAWLAERKKEIEAAGLWYVDVRQSLLQHAGEELFYGSDHHWTTLGAYYGYRAFAEVFGYAVLPQEDYERIAVKEDFWGTLQAKVNLPVARDTMEIFVRKGEGAHPVRFVYENRQADSLYFEERLATKDAYAFFLDGNNPFLEIVGDGPEENSIFLIKDSYANCFVPFLTEQYGKIYVLDKRYYRGQAADLIREYKPVDVLYLYNVFQFMENF